MHSFLFVGFVATVLLASIAAACTVTTGGPCDLGGSEICTASYFMAKIKDSTSTKDIYASFRQCTSDGATSDTPCCEDPCYAYTGTDSCTADPLCVAQPEHTSGASEGAPSVCMLREKLCSLLTVGTGAGDSTTNQCGLYAFCFNDNGVCNYQNPSSGAAGTGTLPPGENIAEKCGALHPMVIAMLALMFVTLVGGIILVGVVVAINQRKANAEDEEAARLAK